MVSGTVVTFNYAGVKRTGTFAKWGKQHPDKALVKWQKDGETEPKNHEVSWQAIHSEITDANDARLVKEEQEEKENKKVLRTQARTDSAKKKLAEAIQKCLALGIDPAELSL